MCGGGGGGSDKNLLGAELTSGGGGLDLRKASEWDGEGSSKQSFF